VALARRDAGSGAGDCGAANLAGGFGEVEADGKSLKIHEGTRSCTELGGGGGKVAGIGLSFPRRGWNRSAGWNGLGLSSGAIYLIVWKVLQEVPTSC